MNSAIIVFVLHIDYCVSTKKCQSMTKRSRSRSLDLLVESQWGSSTSAESFGCADGGSDLLSPVPSTCVERSMMIGLPIVNEVILATIGRPSLQARGVEQLSSLN